MSTKEPQGRDILAKFRIIYGAIRQHNRMVEKSCGVSGAQIWAMSVLARHPGMRVSQLAQALSIHASTTSNLLDKIEAGGLLRRQRSQQDQRVVELYLTQAGQAVLDRAPQPHAGVLSDALDTISEQALHKLHEGLQAVVDHLQLRDDTAAAKPLSEL